MGNVNQCVFVPFRALYGEPPTPDVETFMDLYEQALEGFSDEVLDKAAKRVMADFSGYGWPKLGEVMKACKSIVPAPRPPEHFQDYDIEPPSPMQKAKVERIIIQFRKDMAEKRLKNPPKQETGWDPFSRVGRTEFELMQRNSPNKELHMTEYGLTQLSKRMAGEKDE